MPAGPGKPRRSRLLGTSAPVGPTHSARLQAAAPSCVWPQSPLSPTTEPVVQWLPSRPGPGPCPDPSRLGLGMRPAINCPVCRRLPPAACDQVEWISVFPDHLEVTASGAPPLHVLSQEVGLKQSDIVGVGGPTPTCFGGLQPSPLDRVQGRTSYLRRVFSLEQGGYTSPNPMHFRHGGRSMEKLSIAKRVPSLERSMGDLLASDQWAVEDVSQLRFRSDTQLPVRTCEVTFDRLRTHE
jgi:hypothetical protein